MLVVFVALFEQGKSRFVNKPSFVTQVYLYSVITVTWYALLLFTFTITPGTQPLTQE